VAEKLLETAHFWAHQLGESDKTIRKALEGVEPDGMRGESQPRFYLSTVFRALLGYDQQLDGNKERARKDKEAADKLALDNAERRGDLARISVMEGELAQVAANLRRNALALPTAMASALKGLDADAIRIKLEDALYGVLADFSDYRPGRRTSGSAALSEEGAEGGPAAAEADDQPVGGPEPDLKPRKQRRARPVAN
jgi:terminase small subunit / prophage DNA-packing protein